MIAYIRHRKCPDSSGLDRYSSRGSDSMNNTNRQIVLAARPKGFPKDTDFRFVEVPIPTVAAGQFLVRSIYLSVDPYMRGRIREIKSYAEPVAVGPRHR